MQGAQGRAGQSRAGEAGQNGAGPGRVRGSVKEAKTHKNSMLAESQGLLGIAALRRLWLGMAKENCCDVMNSTVCLGECVVVVMVVVVVVMVRVAVA